MRQVNCAQGNVDSIMDEQEAATTATGDWDFGA